MIKLLKGCFGLVEAPRLWWKKLERVLVEAGCVPVPSAKGVFGIYENGKITGVVAVYVDDGLWAGAGAEYDRVRAKIRAALNIKTECSGCFKFLGRVVTQHADYSSVVDQKQYVLDIEPIHIPKQRRANPKAVATPAEVTKYKSLVAQLAWPARCTLPGLAYDVSDLQQRSCELTIHQMTVANAALKFARQLVMDGACLVFRAVHGKWGVVACHDASFCRQPRGGSQQGYLLMITGSDMKSGQVMATTEWGSSKIHRVVKSTLAAEAASASYAFDRSAFLRVFLDQLLRPQARPWVERLRAVPGRLLTDCKSLRDMCRKEGTLPTERRVALDVEDLREGLERQNTSMQWVTTDRMAADALTKRLKNQKVLDDLCRRGEYHWFVKASTT